MIFIVNFSFLFFFLPPLLRVSELFNLKVPFSPSFSPLDKNTFLCSFPPASWTAAGEKVCPQQERLWRCAQGRYTWLMTGITEIHGKPSISFLQCPLKNQSSTLPNIKLSWVLSYCCLTLVIQPQIQTPNSLPAYMKTMEGKENDKTFDTYVWSIFFNPCPANILFTLRCPTKLPFQLLKQPHYSAVFKWHIWLFSKS